VRNTIGSLARHVLLRAAQAIGAQAGGQPPPGRPRVGKAEDHREPDARRFTEWSPALLKVAEALAERGDLRMAADLCTALSADDRIDSVLGTRVRSLLGLELTFEEAGVAPRKLRQRAVKALELDEDWYEIFPEDQLSDLLRWALLLGVGLGRLQWWEKLRSGKWVPRRRRGRLVPQLQVWNPRWLRYDRERRVWMVLTEGGAEVEVTPGDGEWILLTPYGSGRVAGGLWRGLSRLWLLKSYALDDWGRCSEEHGNPIKSVEATDPKAGYSPEVRKELAQDVDQLGRDSVISLPPGYSLNLVEARANTWEMFSRQIELANTAAAVTTLGVNLLTEMKGGSFAAANTQNLVRIDLRRFDAENESTATRTQALKPWAALNYGDPELAPWPRRATEPPEDRKAIADTWNTAADAVGKLRKAGLEVAPEDVNERFGIPVRRIPGPQPPADQKSSST